MNPIDQKYHLGFEFRLVTNLYKYRFSKEIGQYNSDLTGIQGHVIGYLYGSGIKNPSKDIFQKDIEKVFSIKRSTATKILQSMEKKNLIERVCVEGDARLKKIVLTDKAVKANERIMHTFNKIEKKACEGISDEELEAFYITLDKIKENIGSGETVFQCCCMKGQESREC